MDCSSHIGILLFFGVIVLCCGQNTTTSQWPEDRGIIVTWYYSYYMYSDDAKCQLNHIPRFPGYEEVQGTFEDGFLTPDAPVLIFPDPQSRMKSTAVDFRAKTIYMHDYDKSAIAIGTGYNKELNMKNMEIKDLHTAVSRGNIYIAVDWISHVVYWSDTVFRWIVAAPGKADVVENGYYKILVRSNINIPTGIAVDPHERMLCWAESGGSPKIECSDLGGQQRNTKADSFLKQPGPLEMDRSAKRIYWMDLSLNTLLSTPYAENLPKVLVRIPRSTIYEMALFRNVLYLSDQYDEAVLTLNITTGDMVANGIINSPYTPYGIAVYAEEAQPLADTNYCEQTKCDHFCVSEKSGSRCVCWEGYKRNDTTGNCERYAAGHHTAIVFANTTHICLVDIRSFASLNFNMTCVFSVIKSKQVTESPPAARRRRQVSMSSVNSSISTTAQPATQPPATSTARPPVTTKAPVMNTTTKGTTTTTTAHTTTTTTTTVPTTTTPLVPPGDYINKFTMDMKNRIFFFATADNKIYKRPIDLPIDDVAKELLVTASGNISGLAYDAENPNSLYWSESDTGQIWVINTVTREAVSLGNQNNARDIIVMLNKRKLAVLAGSYRDMSIQTLSMDGTSVTAVVSGKSDISAFAYDSGKELFYYILGTRLYKTSLDGKDVETLYYSVDQDVFAMVTYQDYVAWMFTNSTHPHAVRVYDVVKDDTLPSGKFDDFAIIDIKILDEALQSVDELSPCASNNGGCEQLCVTRYENNVLKPECRCRLGYTLKNDVNCTTGVVTDNFLVFTEWTDEEIMQIDLSNDKIHVVPGDESAEYMGVYYDSQTHKVLFAEYFDSRIVSGNLNGSDRQVLVDLDYSGYAYRFDMDLSSGYLYFTAYFSTYIGVATPSGEYLILNEDFGWDSLGDIVVHPGKGWMYFTITGWGTVSHVGRANMDGTDVVQLITGDHVDYPDGLAIDYIHDRLYWSDATFDTIQGCNLDGIDCKTIVNGSAKNQKEQIRDLVTDGVYLYYCSYNRNYVVRVNLEAPYNTKIVGEHHGLGRIDTMAIYSSQNKNIQPANTVCKDRNGLGDCSTICLPNHFGRTCACEDGVDLKPDGRTCSNIYQCKDVLYQSVELSSGEQNTIDVTMDRTCLRYLDSKCNYKCPVNFEPLFDTLLTCTNAGWNLEPNTLCREIKCPQTIENGVLENSCKREIGEKCDFACKPGFVKTGDRAVCTKTGVFHKPDNELCAPYTCSDLIKNGAVDSTCKRTVGTSCKYSCDEFYTPTMPTSEVECQAGGWKSTDLCKEKLCPGNTLANGTLSAGCSKKIGEGCSFECNQGYVKTTDVAFCKSDNMWHPADSCTPFQCSETIPNGDFVQGCARTIGSSCNYTCMKYYMSNVTSMQATCTADGWSPTSASLCESIKCPASISNGEITGDCDFTIGATCNFKCNDGYERSDVHPNITCKFEGLWFSDKLCLEPPPKKFELSVPGVGAGLGVLALIVLILIVVIVCMIKRRSSSKYDNFDDRGVSMENPGYDREKPSYTQAEGPYSDLREESVTTFTQDAAVVGSGNM